jgi:hypothetical protein
VPENAFYAAFFFPAAAAVLQARVRLGQDEAYRELAGRATAAQAEAGAKLAAFGAALADIQSRLGTIEKILKDVG